MWIPARPLGVSGTITAFRSLSAEVAEQTVETGTTEDELNLPDTLTVTVATGAAITATVSGNDIATDSEAQEQDMAGVYIFTPSLALPEGLTVAEGVYAPQITVTVEEAAAPQVWGAVSALAADDIEINETNFPDTNFRDWLLNSANIDGAGADSTLTAVEVASVTYLDVSDMNIASLAGIEFSPR